MKKYLAWKKSETLCPAIACSPPPPAPAAQFSSNYPFQNLPYTSTTLQSTDIFSGLQNSPEKSAFFSFSQFQQQKAGLQAENKTITDILPCSPPQKLATTAPTSKPIESFLAAALAASRQQQSNTNKQCVVTSPGSDSHSNVNTTTTNPIPSTSAEVAPGGLAPPLLSSTTQVHSPLFSAMAAAVAANCVHSAASLLSSCGPSPAAILQVNSPAALLAQAQHQLSGESCSSSANNFYSPNSSASSTLSLGQNHPSVFQVVAAAAATSNNNSSVNSGEPLFTDYDRQQQNMSTSLAAAAMYPELMSCFPGLLDKLGPHILKSHLSNTQCKPIPNNDRVDLYAFTVKEPREWDSNDVIGWLLDVARRHQIPFENFTTQKLLKCAGPLLVIMTEQSFKECDPSYGSLLFTEFRKLISEDTLIDEWMRSGKAGGNFAEESANNSLNPRRTSLAPPPSNESTLMSPQIKTELVDNCATQRFLNASSEHMRSPVQHSPQQSHLNGFLAAAVAAASRPLNNNGGLLNPQLVQLQQQQASHALQQQQLFHQHHQQQQQQHRQNAGINNVHQQSGSAAMSTARQQLLRANNNKVNNNGEVGIQQVGGTNCVKSLPQLSVNLIKKEEYESKASTSSVDAVYQNPALPLKIRKNKDGRPRKRSQHTKGNKLWEFIRDALKDASTCPSVVRWEDPVEGVFRIVESEKLARLWGDKKNNQKMTYEKLSRAMRTYYEKQILVPVPKTGLYPKKLVYKFGPSAHGWTAPAHLITASHVMEQL